MVEDFKKYSALNNDLCLMWFSTKKSLITSPSLKNPESMNNQIYILQ